MNEVFISYRRKGADKDALLLKMALEQRGYTVFYDLESISKGYFNEQILKNIEECTDFLVMLPPGGLDRCNNEEDWVRKEIVHARKCNKNIIPIMLDGFAFPENLPEEINFLRYLQAANLKTELFADRVDAIERLMISHELRVEEEKRRRAEIERRKAEEYRKINEERRQAQAKIRQLEEEERKRAEEKRKRAKEERKRAEEERKRQGEFIYRK